MCKEGSKERAHLIFKKEGDGTFNVVKKEGEGTFNVVKLLPNPFYYLYMEINYD